MQSSAILRRLRALSARHEPLPKPIAILIPVDGGFSMNGEIYKTLDDALAAKCTDEYILCSIVDAIKPRNAAEQA